MPLLRVTHRLLPEGPRVLMARPRVFPKSSARSSPCTPAVCSPDPARPPSVANARRALHHRNHLRRHCHPVHPPRPSPPSPGASTKSTTRQHRHHDESSPPPPPPGRPEDTAKPAAATPACKPQAAPQPQPLHLHPPHPPTAPTPRRLSGPSSPRPHFPNPSRPGILRSVGPFGLFSTQPPTRTRDATLCPQDRSFLSLGQGHSPPLPAPHPSSHPTP